MWSMRVLLAISFGALGLGKSADVLFVSMLKLVVSILRKAKAEILLLVFSFSQISGNLYITR